MHVTRVLRFMFVTAVAFVGAFVVAVVHVPEATAQRVTHVSDGEPLISRWQQSVDQGGDSFAVGFSFMRLMDAQHYFQRSGKWEMWSNGRSRNDGPSLLQMTTGQIPDGDGLSTAEAVRETARMVLVELGRLDPEENLVERPLGFVVTYHAGRASSVWLGNIELAVNIDATELFWLGDAAPAEALSVFRSLYDAQTGRVQEGAVAAIGSVNDRDAVIPLLGSILEDAEDERIRDEAASWLGRQYDERALPLLVRAVDRDPSKNVREEAVESIGDLRVAASLDALIEIVTSHADSHVRSEAAETIGDFKTPEAARALERVARTDANRSVQNEAVESLGDMPSHLSVPILTEILRSHPIASVRGEVAEALGDRPSDDAVTALRRAALEDQSSSVRDEALEALAEMASGLGIPTLIEVAQTHTSTKTRREAIDLLGESRDPRARAALEGLAGD